MSVPNLKWFIYVRSKVIRGPKCRNLVTWPRPRPLRGRFVVPEQ